MTQKTNKLHEIASKVKAKLIADLAEASPIEHPTTKGDHSEGIWIDLFNDYLPNRFAVSKATIIDSKGEVSQQIDCAIFDSNFTPKIMPKTNSLHIPAEAVYAVFEIKQDVTPEHLKYAATKIKSVREMHRTSSKYTGDGKKQKPKPFFHIIGGLLATRTTWVEGFAARQFCPTLSEAQKISKLDFVFAAEKGFVDTMKTKDNNSPDINADDSAILVGLFRVLEELTKQGTVPALDLSVYKKGFSA